MRLFISFSSAGNELILKPTTEWGETCGLLIVYIIVYIIVMILFLLPLFSLNWHYAFIVKENPTVKYINKNRKDISPAVFMDL